MPQDATPLALICVVGMLLFVIGILALKRLLSGARQMLSPSEARPSDATVPHKEDSPNDSTARS